MIFDFHTHTFFSDGINSPIELIRCAHSYGYKIIAITDHVSYSNIDKVIEGAVKDCKLAQKYWDILAIPGVELTNVPAKSIDEMAKYAKENGAILVVVHGETIVEPVEPGTNFCALNSNFVDILAHPGLITEKDVKLAATNNIYLELTKRQGHCLANGLVAKLSLELGANLLINSDAHSHNDLYKSDFQTKLALSAGLDEKQVENILFNNSKKLLDKLGIKYKWV